jgi:2'-5' RNA ligase
MEQLELFGAKVHEYLLIIKPDSIITNRIIEFRESLNRITSLPKDSLRSKPHISLCYFEATDSSVELIISKTKQAISNITSFKVVLDGCEKWKHGTIILQINKNDQLEKLQKELSKVFKGVTKTLHLTILRNIPGQSLNQLSLDNFPYYGEFNCESILLLKKTANKPYQLLKQIDLLKS